MAFGLEPTPPKAEGRIQEILCRFIEINSVYQTYGTYITQEKKLEIWSKEFFELIYNNIDDPRMFLSFLEISRTLLPRDYLENNLEIVPIFEQILRACLVKKLVVHDDIFKLLTCYLEKAYNTEAN